MANLLENLNIPPCIWFEGEARRNSTVSILSGLLFFMGWWMIIDAASVYPGTVAAGYHMCGVVGTLSLVMVNSVTNAQVRGDSYDAGCLGSRGARIWLFLGFVMGFASVIAACWILFADFVGAKEASQWPGVALFMQNALIFVSSLVFKFGRTEDTY
ncbi:transmembrane protein 50B [Agrilus planipennis]|uniref:Transmembrane protein 50B n=1 Tax=Agrilus planipennis TaxID=224129 RepID=A0A1W4X6E9_AGRPL|nr:transmembrane protein 50B [Agrilus planipennis]XP_018331682.1 transmembrane protein 50B [Agrilus planipennis]